MESQPEQHSCPFHATESRERKLTRRTLLKWGLGSLSVAAPTFHTIDALASVPQRLAHTAPTCLPDIQFNISHYLPPAKTIHGVRFRFGPVHTLFVTAKLTRTPSKKPDQVVLNTALETIEDHYAFSPTGVFTFVSYGLPYFARLPVGLVARYMPRLLLDQQRFALEEAVPGPTDVSSLNPGIVKKTYNVPVVIEANDILFTLRSDSLSNLLDVVNWLEGSNKLHGQQVKSPQFNGLFAFTSVRTMFTQIGLPRKIAESHSLPYAPDINPTSPMWMGFADQQVSGSGPAEITTFQGNPSARFTTTQAGDYFYDGSIQHLSHVILDMKQFYAKPGEPYTERCQYMFRSNPIPSLGNDNQFKDGGGPAYFENTFRGPDDARNNAQGINTYKDGHRIGHLSALQRSSRAGDGTPVHIRMDGPGFDALDVPDGSQQPKLQFTVFVPTADFFKTMRTNAASLDLAQQYHVQADDDGLERFLTATRRQNFLVPPRAKRAFPLLEHI